MYYKNRQFTKALFSGFGFSYTRYTSVYVVYIMLYANNVYTTISYTRFYNKETVTIFTKLEKKHRQEIKNY